VLVADTTDDHSVAVARGLAEAGPQYIHLNLSNLRSTLQVGRAGNLKVEVDGTRFSIDEKTTVWWRRAGSVEVAGLSLDEAQLVRDEGPHLLRGGLAAAGVRWVDDPFVTARAELKQYQLAVAASLGVPVPRSIVTNDMQIATRFAQGGPVIAKPLSPGVGIAPYVDLLSADDLELVPANPTLLQELVPATADLRTVTIAGHGTWIWRRPRQGAIDWRSPDPAGTQFQQIDDAWLEATAGRITESLDLTMSIQDWLETGTGSVFLEANPQGAFMFLAGADRHVVPALVEHLTR
jgi:hypothetical protein